MKRPLPPNHAFLGYRWFTVDNLGWRWGVSFGLHWSWPIRVDLHFLVWIISVGRIPMYKCGKGFTPRPVSDSYHATQRERAREFQEWVVYHKPRR